MRMFEKCTSLKSLYLSNFDTSSVKSFGQMFYGCTSLKYLDISNFYFDNYDYNNDWTNGNIFYNLAELEYINIYNVQDSKGFINNELNNKDGLYVCQKDNAFITNSNIINKCFIQTTFPNNPRYADG